MKTVFRCFRYAYVPALVTMSAFAFGGCDDAPSSGGAAAGEAARLETNGNDEHDGLDPAGAFIPTSLSSEADWCAGHGVPESLCTRCNPVLIPQFKKEGDWCTGHGLPESQCLSCNPTFKARWEALRPATGPKAVTDEETPVRLMAVSRLVQTEDNPFCNVDQYQIRLRDGTIADKAGIRTEPVERRRVSATAEFPGRIVFDQTRRARITPRVEGIIVEAGARIGDQVEAGDVLAVIESPSLGEAKSRYIESRESYNLAKSEFDRVDGIHSATQRVLDSCEATATADEARKNLARVRIGEAKGLLLKAHASLELAQTNLAREAQMREKKISSDLAYQTARSKLRAAEAEFHAIHEATGFSIERDYLRAAKDLKVAKSALDTAERYLYILGLPQEQIDAVATGSDRQLTRYELRSPIAGHIVTTRAVAGEAVDERTALFTVVDLSQVWLMLDVHERDLVDLRLGLPVMFTLDGLPGRSFQGRIDWISREVDPRTRTIKARVNLSNESGVLRANVFGLARVVLHDDDEVLTVSELAVQTDGCCQLVFVQEAPALFRPRKVELGTRANGYVVIHKGLQLGEKVVTTGSFLMKTEVLKSNIGAGCCEVDPGR